jgi:uncharacterized protein YbbC (DUF1343 family)
MSRISAPPVQTGISTLLGERADLLRGRRVAVLSGPSGVLPDLRSSAAALASVADVRAIFGPEHGLLGAAPEGEHVADGRMGGVPVYSLYGDKQAPTPEQLQGIDVVVCDYQDVGARFYTYAWTLVRVMQAAADSGVAVLVCDRPNPAGGVAVEGPGVDADHRTLVGLHDVPIRHGLTLGELARLVQGELAIGCELDVLPCVGWRREMLWADTGLPWVAPSPNMAAAENTLPYPGTCLAEGANLSVGRGTANPFAWLGAPWVDGVALADALNAMELSGVRWRALAFQPALPPYAGETCQGVQPHVTDAASFRPVLAGVALLTALRDLHPAKFALRPADAVYADPRAMQARGYGAAGEWGSMHFDRLAGGPALRMAIEAGTDARTDARTIAAAWAANEAAFLARRSAYLLYE